MSIKAGSESKIFHFLKMNIDQLRHKHRSSIIHHAIRLYGINSDQAQERQWIDYLLGGGELQTLLAALKEKSSLSCNPHHEVVDPVQEGDGVITICDSNLKFRAGEARQVKVEVKNFSNTIWQTNDQTPIYLSYHWYFENGETLLLEGSRTPLSEPVRSGESRQLSLHVQSPGDFGSYLLEVTMVKEGQFWFEHQGLRVSKTPMKVSRKPLSPYATRVYEDLLLAMALRTHEVEQCAL